MPDIGAKKTRLASSISPIFNGLRREEFRAGHGLLVVSDRRIIAAAGTHFAHKSCAVKLHAYTLDSSAYLASALQQICLSRQLWGIVLFSGVGVIRAVRLRTDAPAATQNHRLLSPMPKPERTAAILVAAGRGLRAGAGGPKQYRSIGGQTVIFRAMEPFCRHPQIFAVQPVLNPDDVAMFNAAVSGLRHAPPANGGATRQASVHAGLEALADRKARHRSDPRCRAAIRHGRGDLARDRCGGRSGAAVPAIPVTDTIKLVGDDRQRRSNAGARAAANRADPAGVPLRYHSRSPSPRGARWPQRLHR